MANHPIFYPTFHGDVEGVRALLREDADLVTVRDAKNLTPMHVAASRDQAEIIQLLVSHGGDVQGPSADGQWTPLVFASYRGHLNAVRALLAHNADPTIAGGNPIHYAGQRKHKEICRLLVEHGAIDNTIAPANSAALELFRRVHSFDTAEVAAALAHAPELIDHQDSRGQTPLHIASTYGDTKTVRVLLKNGADALIRDEQDRTASECAAAHRQHAIVKILQQKQA